jgi:hypothetical protein
MSAEPGPSLSDYLRLLEDFTSQRLSARDFERTYLRMFKGDTIIRPGEEYEILNDLFSAADAFCDDPSIISTGMLDENGFRAEARAALNALRRISRTQV